MNRPTHLLIHCSDSAWGDAAEITAWHRARGFRTIGYHYVITNSRPKSRGSDPAADGRIERGRAEDEEGAHCPGFNTRSIGICLIGRGDYTEAQMRTLHELVTELARRYGIPASQILGHRETESGRAKGCPLLDMDQLRAEIARRLEAVAHG